MKRFDIITHMCLFLGGFIFVVIAIVTVENLNDKTVYQVFLPGVLIALPLFIGAMLRQGTPPQKRRERSTWLVSKTHRL